MPKENSQDIKKESPPPRWKTRLTLTSAMPMSADAERQKDAIIDALILHWARTRRQQGEHHAQSHLSQFHVRNPSKV